LLLVNELTSDVKTKGSIIKVLSRPAMKDPLLLVGLPGIGLVSKLAADHLTKEKAAKKFAALYSRHLPNQAIAMKSGRMRLFSIRFYHRKMGSKDVVIVKGDLQPLTVEGQYEVAGDILDFFKELGGKTVVSMAGYAIIKKSEKPAVYCTSTDKALFKKFVSLGAKKTGRTVPIMGLAGLIPALAELNGMHGACLLAETPGNLIDAKAASAMLEVIGKLTGQKIDVKHLEEQAKKAEDALKKFEETARSEQATAPGGAAEVIRKDITYIR